MSFYELVSMSIPCCKEEAEIKLLMASSDERPLPLEAIILATEREEKKNNIIHVHVLMLCS